MSRIGDSVQVRILGDAHNSVATGKVTAILALASDHDAELVELHSGVIGHLCPKNGTTQHQHTAVSALAAHFTVSDIPVSGAHLQIGSHVEVQCLDSQSLDYGRVANIIDATPGSQPIVRLISGTDGAVTCMQSPHLPARPTCLHLLRSNPIVIASPLGASETVLCRVTSVLDSEGPDLIVTGHICTPPPTPGTPPPPTDEITASLVSFLVPFTPSPSLRSSAATTPEPGQFPSLQSPAPSRSPSRGHRAATPSPHTSPAAHLSAPSLSPAPTTAAHPPSDPVAASARGYSSAVSHAASPPGSASPSLSATGSYAGADAMKSPAGAALFDAGWCFSAPPWFPSGELGSADGAASAVRGLGLGMSALAVDAQGGREGVPQDGVRPGGGGRAGGGMAASGSGPELSLLEHAQDEEAWAVAQAEKDLAPKLAVLREECQKLSLSWDRAETLVMLIEDATVPQIIDTLQKYSDSFEAAANHLLNTIASNKGQDGPGYGGFTSAGEDRAPQGPPWQPDAASSPAASSDAKSLAAAQDAWGGAAAPPRRRKKKGKALEGCFQAVPTPYAGAIAQPAHKQNLAAMVKAKKAPEPGLIAKAKPAPAQTPHSKRAAVATSFDDSLPEFLLPFIAEHVRAMEAAGGPAAAGPGPRRDPEWTKVKGKRSPEGKAPRTAASLVTLQSTQFREQCLRELGLIADRTTERLRLLTLCSTAANQRRIYDKSAVHRLEDCTSWINRAKESIVKAHIIAARNTRLSNVPGVIDLHLMDRPTAEQVIQGCIYELQRNLQTGEVHVITGVGNHSHNNKANLKPLVLELIADAGLTHSMNDRNQGMIIMHVRP